jgi:diaminopimelate decarboxylase
VELPPHIATAIDRVDPVRGPALIYDLARIEANAKAVAAAARAANITPLFAAKSFPHPAVRSIAGRALGGFDVASPSELADALRAKAQIISIADPSAAALQHVMSTAGRTRAIISCDLPEHAAAAPANTAIAIRLSSSAGGRDPAIGAAQDGSGHRRSRFGVDVDPDRRRAAIGELVRAAAGRPVGLHVHLGPVIASSAARFIDAATRALADAADAGLAAPAFLNCGGAWHGIADLAAALRDLRAAVPAPIELFVEPGRLYADGAGFACGHVAVARELDDRPLRVLDLSRTCHLRWSQPALLGPPPAPGTGRAILWVGPTCYEEDVVGEWVADPARYPVGTRVIVGDVSGYALGWNTGFGGIAPASVIAVAGP